MGISESAPLDRDTPFGQKNDIFYTSIVKPAEDAACVSKALNGTQHSNLKDQVQLFLIPP